MRPLQVGSGERRLFALYVPAEGRRLRRGVVICPSFGQEYLRSHRSVVLLGRMLARAGCDVFRFDYYGTGDSSGDSEDLTLEGATEDAVTVAREIREVAAVRSTTLVGLRLGAATAARAAREVGADAVVLWDPVVQGKDFVDAMTREALASPTGPAGVHWRGFPFSDRLMDEMRALSVATFDDVAGRVLTVLSDERDEHRRLQRRLEGHEGTALYEVVPAPPCWTEMGNTGRGAVPADLLRRVVEWAAA